MKISPQWLRDFVDLKVNATQLADDLTLAGIAVESISGEGDNAVFEMEIGTNRPDAMNHYGCARECSAIYNVPLRAIEPDLPHSEGETEFKIEIEDGGGCARYTARIIRGVKIKSSPDPIAKRLQSMDQRPINNVADASNYTLWE
ncbi:MAG: phenylalanine--tRNA ligase beta subunit-related protein, partial [Terriglobales bacterium]